MQSIEFFAKDEMKEQKIKQILKEALKEIQPEQGYEDEIFGKLNIIIKKINDGQKNFKAVLGGSGAKGTWLRTFDADIFVLFNYSIFKDKSEKLSDILEKTLKRKFRNVIRLHGSRDYFQIRQGSFTFEIVPILKIQKAEQAKNITDVSPLHSNWVLKHKELSGQMKLAKQFCHAQNIYGAESYIRGFSGYTCEILIAHYGSFLNLIKNAARWGERQVIDAEKYYRGRDVFKLVNTSKLVSPLAVIDPVQKERNAAAALSHENFEKFKNSCREFLKNPSKEFFTKKNLKSVFAADKPQKLIAVKIKPLDGKSDIIGSKLLKIYGFLKQEFENHDFQILKADWEWDKRNDAVFYFSFEKNKKLPNIIEISGPPVKIKNHAENFRKIHKKTFVKSGRLFALEKRKFGAQENLLRQLIKRDFVMERCRSASLQLISPAD